MVFSTDITWTVDGEDRIIEINDAFRRFAVDNDAPHLAWETVGRCLWDFISGREVIQLYEVLLGRVRRQQTAVDFPYRCDSPDHRRYLHMHIEPRDRRGTLLFRSRSVRTEPRQAVDLLRCGLNRQDPPVCMCSWSNRFQTPKGWLEVEDALKELRLFERPVHPQITHGICEECYEQMMSQLSTVG